MSQWGQGQPGYQYPQQTGFPGQFQQQGFQQQQPLAGQPTGFPVRPTSGFGGGPGLQPQQTGFPGAMGFQQPLQVQPTGFAGGNFQQPQQRAPPPPPPVPPIPSRFQQPGQGPTLNVGAVQPGQFGSALAPPGGLLPQQTGFPSGGLLPQQTGFPGAGGLGGGLGGLRPASAPLVPQMTGFVDPRLQMMSNSFMPANISAPYNPAGAPQLQTIQQPLQQSFQQLNQEVRGNAAPRVPWALSKGEKKSYDQIFRAWDSGNTGFIDGKTALEVFGQSGLDRNDLARVWTLADADNRGKLNLPEFHVAMGLIYRRLNGNDIPDVLPPELVPPSHRDLDTSVNFLKEVLKNDSRAQQSGYDTPVSRMKERSFNSSGAEGAGGRQDATVYRHSDSESDVYKPRSRHLDRSAVRTGRESPLSDLSDMKRQLENTAKMLDRATEDNSKRTAEDEALDRELDDLRYRLKRVQDDLEYVSRGPRSAGRDEERRRLERELLHLMHERLPEVEKRVEEREKRKEREKREEWKDRDRRNERFGRYDDRDEDRYASRRYDRDDDYRRRDDDYRRRDDGGHGRREDSRERGYMRGTYDRDDRDRRDRSRDRYERPRSPISSARSPPPPPPAAPSATLDKPAPAPPVPSASPAPRKLTPAERQAEAQRRIQERMRALGVTTPGAPSVDTSVEDRLAQEKKEAEEKARKAEEEAAERERARKERLENERAMKEGLNTPAPPTPKAEALSAPAQAAPAPPAPKPPAPAPPTHKRAPAPPPPRAPKKAPSVPTPPVVVAPPAPPAPAPVPAVPEVDPEEEAFRAREAELKKRREEQARRLRELEQQEQEARRMEEEYQQRRAAFLQRSSSPAPAAPAPPAPAPVSAPIPPASATSPPPPPAPPAPVTPGSSFNPFNKFKQQSPAASASPPAAPGSGSTNPFFKGPGATPASPPSTVPTPSSALPAPAPPVQRSTPIPPAPPVSKSPAPKATYHTAPGDSDADDWGDVQEKEEEDSSDDEYVKSRNVRANLAQQIFGGMLPSPVSRPESAAATPAPQALSPTTVEAPPPPPAPEAPPAPPPPAAPIAPPPPPAPVAPPPPAVAVSSGPGDRSALFSAIQGGARLRKAKTNDRSGAALAGNVLGDTAPPPHINAAPRPASPPAPKETSDTSIVPAVVSDAAEAVGGKWRQSVAWVSGMAAEVLPGGERLPSTQEEDEYQTDAPSAVPDIQVSSASQDIDPLADIDKSVEYKVRSLYPYQGQRPEDLTFGENSIIVANPSKSGSDWWYGKLVRDGRAGFFPSTYVQQIHPVRAKALYSYTGENAEELSFTEGDVITIIDQSDTDWWKAEQDGVAFIVPAAYFETEG